jgi:hypothetical protein
VAQRRSQPDDGAHFLARLPGTRRAILLALPVLLLATVAMARAVTVGPPTLLGLTVGAEEATPEQLTAAAADVLDEALARGAGITFEIVQRQVLVAPEGGPLLEIPDPADRDKVLEVTDRYELHVLVERGVATPDGFWAEILAGPPPGDLAGYDPDTAEVRRAALVRDGRAYRDDGTGWYATDALPGIGLDPTTLARLAGTVRGEVEAKDAPLAEPADGLDAVGGLAGPGGEPVRALAADLAPADLPGVIASDALALTEIVAPATYRFDAQGRLVGLTVIARNTAMDRAHLVVETSYAFAYPDRAPALPEPVPAYVPTPTPADSAGA